MDLAVLAEKDDVAGHDQEQGGTSSTLVQTKATASSSSQWTDEKHSSYLNSIESTFVEQLYKSLDTSDLNLDSKSSKNKQTGQFKVLREGHWSKLNFKIDIADNKQCHDPRVDLLDSPWIRHYSSNSTRKFAESLKTTEKNVESLRDYSASEVMDQNFVDDDEDEEEAKRGHYDVKRCRTSTAFANQMIPGCKAEGEGDSSEDHLQCDED